ncbi:MAG: flagellar motor protein [Oleiphilaceae bacterium]|nr:flagellar motor protein [Oleiphilaceae bacterium]
MDLLSLVGILLAFVAILGGNFLEGGTLMSLVNLPAAVIVLGGTLAAVILQTPKATLQRALSLLRWVFLPPQLSLQDGMDKVVGWSLRSRQQGILGLESVAGAEKEPFARKGLQLLVDGVEPAFIRSMLETDLETREHRDVEAARVFESMGGYSPTIGIIGAVMGLIQVMTNLEDPSTLGAGIAVAFVATIYGIALANLLFFPVAYKLRSLIRQRVRYEEMMIEGLLGVLDGENPRSIQSRMGGFMH